MVTGGLHLHRSTELILANLDVTDTAQDMLRFGNGGALVATEGHRFPAVIAGMAIFIEACVLLSPCCRVAASSSRLAPYWARDAANSAWDRAPPTSQEEGQPSSAKTQVGRHAWTAQCLLVAVQAVQRSHTSRFLVISAPLGCQLPAVLPPRTGGGGG